MKSNLEPSAQEVLAGLVERVTFHNSESGFCVLRAKARGHRDLGTVVGHAAIISAGEWTRQYVSNHLATDTPPISHKLKH
jgi:exodeoxyribonuclease V alpha subunit